MGAGVAMLRVFRDVEIPADYASVQKYAILARSGGGKTYTLAKLLEQFCDAGLFFVVLDPVGKHWSLRAGIDGKPRGGKSDVVVLGGQHGDVPLASEDGALIADVVVQHPGRYVLDVSDFDSDAEQDRFAHAFAKRLFRAKKANQFPLLVALEEAEAFIPQVVQPGQQQMQGAFARLQKVGRNYGIGMCLVSQRPQDLAKKVLNQTEVLVIKQLVAKHERDAVVDWVKFNGVEVDLNAIMREVASFEPKDALVYSPSWLRVFTRTTVLKRDTFDSSASARTGDATVTPELKPLDVAALAGQLADAREQAKADDPKELRKRIKTLEAKLAEGGGADADELAAAKARVAELEAEVTEAWQSAAASEHIVDAVRAALQDTNFTSAEPAPKPPAPRPAGAPTPKREASVAPSAAATGAGEPSAVNAPRQRILDTIAWFEAIGVTAPKRAAVGPLAGTTSTSSGFEKNLSGLRTAGLIDYPQTGRLGLTADGRRIARKPEGAPTSEALHEAVLSKLNAPRAAILRALLKSYPKPLTRAQIADRVGVSGTSSGFEKNLSGMRTLELIDYPSKGWVVAADLLFVESC